MGCLFIKSIIVVTQVVGEASNRGGVCDEVAYANNVGFRTRISPIVCIVFIVSEVTKDGNEAGSTARGTVQRRYVFKEGITGKATGNYQGKKENGTQHVEEVGGVVVAG